MFERLMLYGASLARKVASERVGAVAAALAEDAPAGVRVSEEEGAVALSGRGLRRRFALDPAVRWLLAGRRR
jgi:hypothetical protein